MKILAIESSCDETSASVIQDTVILSNVIHSQVFHERFGGVVPELASRAHLNRISQITKQSLDEAKINIEDIDALAVTTQPGLVGSLIVGSNFAKGLAIKYNLPLIPVNHIEGHIFSACIQEPELDFPFITLVVSGGHTALFLVESYNTYSLLGTTRDDAAGEAFDKIASMFGLDYPGGPLIDKFSKNGNPKSYEFPRSMIGSGDFDFSFSGLKTSVRYFLAKNFPKGINNEVVPDLCASVQQAIIDVLVKKTIDAAIKYNVNRIVIGGGVSANSQLRKQMFDFASLKRISVTVPDMSYCIDNAAMIAFLAEKRLDESGKSSFMNLKFTVNATFIPKRKKK